jgi:hypothetical protein
VLFGRLDRLAASDESFVKFALAVAVSRRLTSSR